MSDEALAQEVRALRDQVARLEADRAKPAVVDVAGFEGLRQLSDAIEHKNLDAFMLDRGVPDRWFWGSIIAFPVLFVAGCWILDFLP